MRLSTNKLEDNVKFEYHDIVPIKKVQLRIEGKPTSLLNQTLVQLYRLYRDLLYATYKQEVNLDQDIKEYREVFHEKNVKQLRGAPVYDPIYHYLVEASLEAMKAWKDSNGKIKCYIAYIKMPDDKMIPVGFVHFTQGNVNKKSVIYIAHAGVSLQGKGIGTKLMEYVLSHYPAGTEFYVLTRKFNTVARNLYNKRLNFDPIEVNEIKQLGYNQEYYCGFKHITTQSEINQLKTQLVPIEEMPTIQSLGSENELEGSSNAELELVLKYLAVPS